MNEQVVELSDRVVAFVAKDGAFLLFLVIWNVVFFSTGRLYTRFKDAGRERMGLFLVGAIQSWLLVAVVTVTIWWKVLFRDMPLWVLQAELWLQAPFWPGTMVFWSAGLLLGLVAVALVFGGIEDALGIPPTRLRLLMHPHTTTETVVWSLIVSPTAGFCEEVVFRAVLLSGLTVLTDDLWFSVALSSVLFGLVHAYQGLLGVLATTAMGVMLAVGVIHAGSLWPAIIAHTLYDMAVPFLSRIEVSAEGDLMAQRELGV